jgi:GDP-4-dehydro-6-deoxy-D-mannose reductase
MVRQLGISCNQDRVGYRVLITGGTGFVGTHLIQFLKSKASKMAVIASGDSRSRQKPEPGVEYYELDIRRADEVRSVVREVSPTQIYHLAGISAVDVSWNNPRLTFEVNVLGAYNLFDAAMSLATPPRILNVSTSQVYASSDGILTETSPVSPDNPYSASKAMAELLGVQYRKSAGGGIITARPFNHTGPGQSPNFVLPSIGKQFAEMEAGLCAPKLAVGNIDVKRDFTDVRDVVLAYSALLNEGRTGEVYNVCSGSAVRLADLIRKFEAISGLPIEINTDPERIRSNEVSQIVGDSTKIRLETGWNPQIPLEKTIRDLLDYWRERIKGEDSSEAQ